ncbi:MAG: hypothetical protein LC723_13990 [Actinobacteria bacterium]|nr:hypothetical protein [Actinomycetota bacterium]
MGDYESTYWIIDTGGVSIAGGMVPVEHAEHPSISGRSLSVPTIGGAIIYIDVDDLGMAVSEAVSLGGVVVRPPAVISEDAGSYAQIKDTEGNVIGLWCASSSAQRLDDV